jgi:N-succinyl-L-ornithine transcarbamylase
MGFLKYATVPVVNMESAAESVTIALADAITMAEHKTNTDQSSFDLGAILKHCLKLFLIPLMEMMQLQDADFVIHIPKAEILKSRKIPRLNTIRLSKMLILSTPKKLE